MMLGVELDRDNLSFTHMWKSVPYIWTSNFSYVCGVPWAPGPKPRFLGTLIQSDDSRRGGCLNG